MRRTQWVFSIASILLLLAGCGHRNTNTTIDTATTHLSTGLHAFTDCNSTLDYFKSEATTAMEIQPAR